MTLEDPSHLSLVVVIPVYNEQEVISQVFNEWNEALSKISNGSRYLFIFVNDGSKDKTQEVLEGLKSSHPASIEIIHKMNSGHGRSCRVGYDAAVSKKPDWVLQIDSDGQCDPKYFQNFWERRNSVDCVFGIRTSRGDGFARQVVMFFCRTLTSMMTGLRLRDPNVPYRLIKADCLEKALQKVPAGFDIQNVALTISLQRMKDLKWAYVPIFFRPRCGGTNSVNVKRIVKMGLKMLKDLHRAKL